MLNFTIEGNIGAGKSTFLEYLSQKFPNRVNVYCEPVKRWRNVNNVNLFDLMYKDPKRYGFVFQSYVQLTMLEMHDEISRIQAEQESQFKKNFEEKQIHLKLQDKNQQLTKDRTLIFKDLTNKNDKKIEINDKKRKSSLNDEQSQQKKFLKTHQQNADQDKLKDEDSLNVFSDFILNRKSINEPELQYSINMMERSIFSARYIFVENLFQNDLLTDIEYKILDDTFLFFIKSQKIKLDLIIYLRSTPEQCYKRMVERSRPEETQTLQLKHFEKFHQLHEDFLIGENCLLKKVLNVPVIVIDTMDSKEKMFQKIDQHSFFFMNDLIEEKSTRLTEITCEDN